VKENAESLDLRGVSSSLRRNDGGRVEDVDFDVSGVIDVDRVVYSCEGHMQYPTLNMVAE